MNKKDNKEIHQYLYNNPSDDNIFNIFNRDFSSIKRPQTRKLKLTSYYHIDSSDNRIVFIVEDYNFNIYEDGTFLNYSIYRISELESIFKKILTYIKYKNRKDIIDSI